MTSTRTGVRSASRAALLAVMLLCAVGFATLRGAGSWAQAPSPSEPATNALDIGADTLSVAGESQEARFSGNVVARRGDWVLSCPELVARYDAEGNLLGADAAGPVVLTGPELYAEAGSARFDRVADTVVLEGDPTLRRGQSVLRARKVVVNLGNRQVELEGVRGRIVMEDADLAAPRGAPPRSEP